MMPSPADRIRLEWNNGDEFARLDVNLNEMCASITYSGEEAAGEGRLVWQSDVEA
jgi:hypothetical protein